MSTRQFTDPVDGADSYTWVKTPNSDTERDRARDTVVRHASSAADLTNLLEALGLDTP